MWWFLWVLSLVLAPLAVHLYWQRRLGVIASRQRLEVEELSRARENQAREDQTRQAALFNSMMEGVLVLDADGRVLLANPALNRLLGTATDIRGKSLLEAVRLHELADLAATVTVEKQLVGHLLRVPGPPERWLELNAVVIGGRDPQPGGKLLVFHDLTRIKELERAREEFVANVSHELRTPLSLIKGYVETLLGGAMDNADVARKFLNTIDRNAERLHLLIDDLLAISELESGRIRLDLQSVDLARTVETVTGSYQAAAAAKHTRLCTAVGNYQVRADINRLEQVLNNLLDNAIKYGRTEGLVTISASPQSDSMLEIVVEDDGPGIPADALQRVFERFYRVDKARSREQGGTGLGLAIVKHIVQSHGGRVGVVSKPGEGAAFSFTLPLYPGGVQQVLL